MSKFGPRLSSLLLTCELYLPTDSIGLPRCLPWMSSLKVSFVLSVFESVRSAVRACTVWLILISSLLLLFAVLTAAMALHCDDSVRGDVAAW